MIKPAPEARCLIDISAISNPEGKESNILNKDESSSEQWIVIGNGLTPVDCYIELIVMEMLPNEKSMCSITCCNGQNVDCVIQLLRVENPNPPFTRSALENLSRAKNYKEKGVQMFPRYPLFAHTYFNRAAKCLLSCAPLDALDPALEGPDTIEEMQTLLEIIYLNISACLIKQNRFEEVMQVLKFVKHQVKPSDKAIYRMALAQYHVKQFSEAIETLERIDYMANKECSTLFHRIKTTKQQEENAYNNMVKKMFG
ncbi:uncharacterized protein LOC134206646 [Armigeres subalbatus]|uniref:uncharacterized protein LOC134206646 n=1 Tax=Armigeres subalbatus TaxID=124917 RepID=UPI002ED5A1B0